MVVPSCSWAERSGCFVNVDGKIQPFDASIPPIEGCQRDGNYLAALNGIEGLYQPAKIRQMMAEKMPKFLELHVAPPLAAHAH